jgi:signal transduction histidine kinase
MIRVDREKLKQVLINLVRNAIEAMPRGGTLTVSARVTEGSAMIAVADTGVGIEPGLDIFGFFTTTKKGGTGLGLPIARRIVEGHGGTLSYESATGQGTTFTITLNAGAGTNGEFVAEPEA